MLPSPITGMSVKLNRSYVTAVLSWGIPPTQSIDIRAAEGVKLASFPLEFVARGGNNTWQYILDTVGMLVEEGDSPLPSVILDSRGMEVRLDEVPVRGTFTFHQAGE